MNGTLILACNELRRLFVQPLAWALLAAILGVLAYFFLLSLEAFLVSMPKLAGLTTSPGVGDLVALPLFRATASLLLLVVPLLGMRAVAGERQAATLPLLLASGIGDVRIVLGKFLAIVAFLAVLIALSVAMPLSLEIGTTLDLGRIATATAGLVLFAAALGALALCASSFAQQPTVAAILALALNLVLWMLDAGARFEGVTSSFINYLALPTHLEPFLHGIVSTLDIVYFSLVIAVSLTLAARRLGAIRVHA